MSRFDKELRYTVLKNRDIKNALTSLEQKILRDICMKVVDYRTNIMNKEDLQCVVIEHDWPEYEIVWKMLRERIKSE